MVRHSVAMALPSNHYQLYTLLDPEFDLVLATLSLVFRSSILDNLRAWQHARAYTLQYVLSFFNAWLSNDSAAHR